MGRLRFSLGSRGRDGGSPRCNPCGSRGPGVPPPEPASNRLVRVLASPAHKFLRGDPRPSLLSRKLALPAALSLLIAAGCGESGVVASGATVNAYVTAALCAEAEEELARRGGQGGDVRIRVTCLPSVESDGGLDLAAIGANARRATEDSSVIAYIGERTKAATRFSEPILEEAGIRQFSSMSGTQAMGKLLNTLDEEGRVSPRGNL
jgi:hypothetical protein